MLVLMSTPGALRDGLAASLRQAGHQTKIVEPEHDDPFGAAAGAKAVVYVPSPNLRDDTTALASRDRVQAAITAARAPGVEVLVVLLPLSGYGEEIDALATEGIPYVVLRAPMLIEELGEALGPARWLFVGKDESVRALELAAVARAIEEAVETEEQGRVSELGQSPLPAWAALERAAEAAGRRVRVIAMWPPLARAARWLARLLRRDPPPALATCERFALPQA